MKSFKQYLNEMMHPMDAELLRKQIVKQFNLDDSDARRKEFSEDDVGIVLDKYALDYHNVTADAINKLIAPHRWSINQNNDTRMLLKPMDTNPVAQNKTLDFDDMSAQETANQLRDYGFIHVSQATPEVILSSGIRAKSSATWDQHDEKRIYLFSLAPQLVKRKSSYRNASSSVDCDYLASLWTDENDNLAKMIYHFAKERFKKEPNKPIFVYYINKLQKPAQLYVDKQFFGNNFQYTALYTKDYAISPDNIACLGTVEDLDIACERLANNNYDDVNSLMSSALPDFADSALSAILSDAQGDVTYDTDVADRAAAFKTQVVDADDDIRAAFEAAIHYIKVKYETAKYDYSTITMDDMLCAMMSTSAAYNTTKHMLKVYLAAHSIADKNDSYEVNKKLRYADLQFFETCKSCLTAYLKYKAITNNT